MRNFKRRILASELAGKQTKPSRHGAKARVVVAVEVEGVVLGEAVVEAVGKKGEEEAGVEDLERKPSVTAVAKRVTSDPTVRRKKRLATSARRWDTFRKCARRLVRRRITEEALEGILGVAPVKEVLVGALGWREHLKLVSLTVSTPFTVKRWWRHSKKFRLIRDGWPIQVVIPITIDTRYVS